MASDARISVTFAAHPKTKKLIRRHGHVAGWGLVCLFLWTVANRPDGDLSGMSAEDIELAVDWGGQDGALVAALKDVGFLDGGEGSYAIHDWAEHNPWAAGARDRSDASKFAALCKRYGREQAAAMMPDYAERMRPARDPDAQPAKPQCPDTASASVSESKPPKPPKGGRARKSSDIEYSNAFQRLMGVYPTRGTARNPWPPAWKAWLAALERGGDPETIIAAAERYAKTETAGTKFTAQTATWLNQDDWKQAPPAPAQPAADPEETRWKLRVDGFDRSGFWNRDQWGPAPNEAGCQAPKALISTRKPVDDFDPERDMPAHCRRAPYLKAAS